MDSIPTEGDRAYRKRRTLRVEGFDNEEYYAIQESDRLNWMDKNWKKHVKRPKNTEQGQGDQPMPSTGRKRDDSDKNDPILTMGQRIFKTRITCPGRGCSDGFIFNVWLTELVKHCFFLGVLTVCTLAYTSNNNYYFIGLMKNKFVDATGFEDVSTVSDVWNWLDQPFVDALYDENLDFNMMISQPRMRMQRVRPDSCSVHKDFQDEIDICYDSYSRAAESTSPFGEQGEATVDESSSVSKAYKYTDLPGSIFGYDFWGEALPYLRMYYAGGYLQFLPGDKGDKETAKSAITALKEKDWLSKGARILLIDIQYYNGNINILSVMRLAFEIPATGGVVPSVQFRTLQHMSGLDGLDIYTIINETLFMILVGYFIGEKIFEMRQAGRQVFKSFQSKVFAVNLLLCVAAIIFKIVKYAILDIEFLKSCDPAEETPGDCYLVNFVYWERQFENIVSIIVFLHWFSFYKFFADFPSMAVFTTTFSRAANEMISFMLVYMVTYLAFAQLGVLIFGNELDGYRNVFHAIFTLFKIILGDFDFNAMQSTNRVLGPIYFLSYVFCVFFFLMNMFLAIISDTYSEVKADLSVSDRRFPVSEYIDSLKSSVYKKMNCYPDDSETIASAIRNLDLKDDQEINWESFRREMLKAGVPDDEIKDFFQKYDTDGSMTMDKKELDRLKLSFEKLGRTSSAEVRQDGEGGETSKADMSDFLNSDELAAKMKKDFISADEFGRLLQRVEKMESYMPDLIAKVDGILVNVDQLSQRKKQEVLKK